MFFIKLIILGLIFFFSLLIGKSIAKKYSDRVTQLKDMKNALNMFETKMKFTYESVPEIFEEISQKIKNSVGKIFNESSRRMKIKSAGEAWIDSIDEIETSFNDEDKSILKNLR